MDKKIDNIIEQLKRGKRSAFGELYKIYAKKLYPICLRYSSNPQEAEDNLQEGFIIVFKKISKYKGTGSFDGWIKRLFINQCLGEYRKQIYILNEDFTENIPESIEDETINIETNTILTLIQQLPTQYRLVFNMYVLDSYSHAEISKELSINIGTSKSNLSRAKQILRKELKRIKDEE